MQWIPPITIQAEDESAPNMKYRFFHHSLFNYPNTYRLLAPPADMVEGYRKRRWKPYWLHMTRNGRKVPTSLLDLERQNFEQDKPTEINQDIYRILQK